MINNSKLSLILLFCTAWQVHGSDVKDKRQVGSVLLEKDEPQVAESGLAGLSAGSGGSKYFQYAHVPAKDHYEHGHKRGNDHHFIERHEKAHPHAGEFKTKVRWGDKHGGYGEHYWDYNHDGHGHDGSGEESQQNEEYTNYEETKHIPVTTSVNGGGGNRDKRQQLISDDVEFINENVKSLVLSGITGRHGGNYKNERDYERGKREHKGRINPKHLVYEPTRGLIVDEKTGIAYELKPVDY